MEQEILKIKNIIVSEIDPEKIFYLAMGPIVLFLIIWNNQMSDSEKRIYIRRLLRSIKITYDITVFTSRDFQKSFDDGEFLTLETVKSGTILYDKGNNGLY